METKFHVNPIHIVRGLQAFLALLVLALLAHVVQFFNANPISTKTSDFTGEIPNKVPGELIFAIFVPVLTLLITLPYVLLTPRYFPHLFATHTKHTILALESTTMTLWFAAFVAVAKYIGALNTCRGHICTTAKAGAGVAFFAWASWIVTSFFALRFCLGNNGVGGSGRKGSDGGSGITKGDRVRERVVRGLRLHNVWTGHGGRRSSEEEGASPRSYNVTRSQSNANSDYGYGARNVQQQQPYQHQNQQSWV